ncbi:MAG: EAL domain-containing protein [Magnetococcales bacterium]|nr:EAL domain-containing protein [Magnetococcales bacterium]
MPDTMNDDSFRQALQQQEFIFYYQPKVSMISGKITGAEALIRWQRSDGSIVTPDHFIPYVEQRGLIKQITRIAIDNAVDHLQKIKRLGLALQVAVNITYQDLEDDGLIKHLRSLIQSGDLDATLLQLEITERTVIRSPEEVQNRLAQLAETGMTIAIDDFGIGYTSLEVLSNLPFSTIKLDRSLIRDVATNKKKARIVSSSVRMARLLNMSTVAEGIEDKACYEKLMRLGCTYGQGYWLSRPASFEQFFELSQTRQWKGNPCGQLHLMQLDHMEWRKDILEEVSYLVSLSKSEKRKIDIETVARGHSDYRSCNLGKWYYGVGREFRQYQIYNQMEATHTALHQTGAKLIRMAAKQGRFERLQEEMNTLNELSGQIIMFLEKLETQVQYDTLKFNQVFTEQDFLQSGDMVWNRAMEKRVGYHNRGTIISRNITRFPAG